MKIEQPELRDGRVVICHDDPDYGPWTVTAVQPRGLKAAWRVLRGRYEAQVTLDQRYTSVGYSKMLKKLYGDPVRKALSESSSLIFPIRKGDA